MVYTKKWTFTSGRNNNKTILIETKTTYADLLQQSKKYFEKDSDQVIRDFVLSEEHPDANPLFLRLRDSVLISPHFAEFFTYVLHAVLDRDIFEKEVEKRSRVFELNIVREEFEKQGFRYLLNQGIKNKMQIDGIAISNSKVYVIEVKGWKAKDLIQDSRTREILEEEIRNAIDGLSFTRNSGSTKKKVPLPQKVEWVKNHRKNLGISEKADIIGMLVINREPVISEHRSCIIRYVDDFEFN